MLTKYRKETIISRLQDVLEELDEIANYIEFDCGVRSVDDDRSYQINCISSQIESVIKSFDGSPIPKRKDRSAKRETDR